MSTTSNNDARQEGNGMNSPTARHHRAVTACAVACAFVWGTACSSSDGDVGTNATTTTAALDDGAQSEPGETTTSPASESGQVAAETTTPQSTDTLGAGEAAIGETITFDDGGVARVNGVRGDAPVRNTFDRSRAGGATSSTEIEVEHCIGGDDYQPDLDWQPPEHWLVAERWTGILDDGTAVEARAGYYMLLESRPGACSRGYVTIPSPPDSDVVAVTLSPSVGGVDEPIGRWDLTRSQPIEAPLQPATLPDAAELGEQMTPPYFDIYDVTVLEIIDNAAPKPSGRDLYDQMTDQTSSGETGQSTTVESPANRKLVEIRAEVCTDPLLPAPAPGTSYSGPGELMWLIQTTDNYVGNPGGETGNGWWLYDENTPLWFGGLIVDGDVARDVPANGECVQGYVQIDLPDDATPAYAIITVGDGHFKEIGRIKLGA